MALAYAGFVGLRIVYPIDYVDALSAAAEAHDLDPALVAAMICTESRFVTNARSPEGAVGLMQIMPTTGAWIADQLSLENYDDARLLDPSVNLRLATWYLAYLIDRFASLDQALVAYNAGPSVAEQWCGNPDSLYVETVLYVQRVRFRVPIYRFWLRCRFIVSITPSILGLRR